MGVCVVVVNHDRAALLADCLSALQHQSYAEFEVRVVDNGSTDSSCGVVESIAAADPRFRLLRIESNLGFAAGCNRGFEEVRTDFVALLNNDAVPDRDWLKCLVGCADRSEARVGMWASKILLYDSHVIDKCGHALYLDGQNRGRGTGEPDTGQFDDSFETLFPDGCAALYRRALLEETGGFDESFFAYGDDADLGLRARWLGWECRFVPAAIVHHRHSSTTGSFAPQKIYWVERNRIWVALKTLPLPLLIVSPVLTLNRWFWNLASALRGRGPAGEAARRGSLANVAAAITRAQWDGWAKALEMLAKRRALMRRRTVTTRDYLALLWRHRLTARELARTPVTRL